MSQKLRQSCMMVRVLQNLSVMNMHFRELCWLFPLLMRFVTPNFVIQNQNNEEVAASPRKETSRGQSKDIAIAAANRNGFLASSLSVTHPPCLVENAISISNVLQRSFVNLAAVILVPKMVLETKSGTCPRDRCKIGTGHTWARLQVCKRSTYVTEGVILYMASTTIVAVLLSSGDSFEQYFHNNKSEFCPLSLAPCTLECN